MPTVSSATDICGIAKACGYEYVACADNFETLDNELHKCKSLNKLCLLEIKSSIGARADLGRPTTTAIENKVNFMSYLKSDKESLLLSK
jgi:phosphonopyruvate decarboxylase